MAAANERALLRALAARGRFNGSASLAAARETCTGRLRALGFTVRERPFEFSTLPARFGMPAVGGASLAFLLAIMGVHAGGTIVAAAGVAAVGAAILIALARWLTSAGALTLPWGRGAGVNLEAVRGPDPRVWLVAHLDSKSQRYPLALRAAGATLTIAGWAAALGMVGAGLAGQRWWHPWLVWLPSSVGAALLMFASVGDDSPGAVDNASGVVAVLAAAAALPADAPVGILITDAEERGLAGAHAWARGRSVGTAIDCDTIDDGGALMLLTSGRRPAALARAVERAGARTGIGCRARRLPAGVLTDGVALARAGWTCATLSRASVGTLLRIHTPRDSVEHLSGDAIVQAAALLAATVQEMC